MKQATIEAVDRKTGDSHVIAVDQEDLERLQQEDWFWIKGKVPYRLLGNTEKVQSNGKSAQPITHAILGLPVETRGIRIRVMNGEYTDMRKNNLREGPGRGTKNARQAEAVQANAAARMGNLKPRSRSDASDFVKPAHGELHITKETRDVWVVRRRNRNGNLVTVYEGFNEKAAKEAAFESMFPGRG